nr:metallophosphatase [Treponema sp.]
MKLKRIFTVAALFFTSVLMTANAKGPKTFEPNDKDITVLYTNDVHCAIDANIGYASLSAYKNDMQESSYVAVVDNGDIIQGDVIGAISKGEYLIDIMNNVGFDASVFGNHEFDYGMDQLKYLVEKSNFQWLAGNIKYKGNKETFLKDTVPYIIKEYGNKKVAFIGITTPDSISTSTPSYFQENDKFVYSFISNKDGKSLNKQVQKLVNKAKKQGADYVILMSHLGDQPSESGSTSISVIQNTTGINAVLDGHSHSVIPQQFVKNKNGADVLLTSTGTKFASFGKLTISKDGKLSSQLINNYDKKDEATQNYIDAIIASYKKDLDKIVAHSDIPLKIS